ncbi:MAG TPA: hypothetical protein VFK54_08075 [Candidatus Limnocylindrales bacterium]|nr:hypothetical protein [Candidatus Limnocylindrales bacterium]
MAHGWTIPTALLALALAGCGLAGIGAGVGTGDRGPCTLELAMRDPVAGSVPLRPPYVVGMTARTPSGVRTAHVEYVATGWRQAAISVRSPAGVEIASAIRWFDRSSWGQGFDVPGLWTIRWVDDAAGCQRELSVLVLA